jgi:hypothetical protein
MSEDKKPFTVSDRRHFTSEGEVRKSDADESPAAHPAPETDTTAPPPSPPAAASPRPPGPGPAPVPTPAGTEAAGGPAGPFEEAGGGRYPADLLGLLISLGAQASMLMMGGPEGEPPDLEAAHSLIELLADLKEKTEGRRTPQEDQLIQGLLYELRMAYVQATKAGGR